MKAVVTGATGFLGSHLVEELLRRDFEVIAIVRRKENVSKAWHDAKVQVIECSLEGYCDLAEHMKDKAQNALFFHFAWPGVSGRDKSEAAIQIMNIQYSLDAYSLAECMGCTRFVYAGSINEYEGLACHSGTYQNPSMQNYYKAAKACANIFLRIASSKGKMDYVSLIISNAYGPGEESKRFISSSIKAMLAGESLDLSQCTQPYDFVYIDDAVRAIVDASLWDGHSGCPIYIGHKQQRVLKEYVREMRDVLQSASKLHFGALASTDPAVAYTEFDTELLEEKLHFSFKVPFAEGIARTAAWRKSRDKASCDEKGTC